MTDRQQDAAAGAVQATDGGGHVTAHRLRDGACTRCGLTNAEVFLDGAPLLPCSGGHVSGPAQIEHTLKYDLSGAERDAFGEVIHVLREIAEGNDRD